MNKYEKAIVSYELERKKLAIISKKRAELMESCEKQDFFEDIPICLVVAGKDTLKAREENGEYYHYYEILDEGHANGEYCDNCYNAYQLKIGLLKDARIKFGVEKRRISALGRSLIKNDKTMTKGD